MFPSSAKREIRHFDVVVVQRRQRNVQKSVIGTCKVVVLCNKPVAFLPFSLPSPSWLLKLPKEASTEERSWFPYNRPNRPKFPKVKSLVSRRLYGTEPCLINCPQIYSAHVIWSWCITCQALEEWTGLDSNDVCSKFNPISTGSPLASKIWAFKKCSWAETWGIELYVDNAWKNCIHKC